MAMCQEHGSTLQEVQQLMKKNQVKKKKVRIGSDSTTEIILSPLFLWFYIEKA